MPLGFAAAPLTYLDAAGMDRIHETSLRILDRVGSRVEHPEARDILLAAGARLDSRGRVIIAESLVADALATVPRALTIFDRQGRPALDLSGTHGYFGTGSDCQWLLDGSTEEPREFLHADVIDAVRLADALPHIDFVMGMGMAPDLDPVTGFRAKMAAMLRHTEKPLVLICGPDLNILKAMVRMAEAVAGGREALRRAPNFLLLVDPTSPLVHTAEALDKLLFMARGRLPLIYAPGIMAGATSPVTIAGAIAQANAEILAGLVVHQLAAPGAPFVHGGGLSPMDMKSSQPTYAAPEAMVAQAGLTQLGRDFYHLPTWGFGGCSAAKSCDLQAINEAAGYLMMSAWMGTNLVHDIGYLEFGTTYSFELLVACDEVVGQIRKLMEGIALDDESLALDAIERVGPAGSFLPDPHTLRHFRSNWMPDLTDRNSRRVWHKNGGTRMEQRIREKIARILATHEPVPLDPEIDRRVEAILQETA